MTGSWNHKWHAGIHILKSGVKSNIEKWSSTDQRQVIKDCKTINMF
jgi:hypothetical protein